jgi:cytochrome c556
MRFIAIAFAVAALAACEKPAADSQQASANRAANASEDANSTAAAPAAPLSKEAALKLMHDRHENMEKIGDATKAASRTLKSGTPDLAVIRSSAATIAGLAPEVPSWFPAGTGPDVGKTEAKAEIWQKPDDFAAKTRAFQQAALAFDAAAKAGEMPAVQARFADLGKTCKGCHDLYREEDE